MNKIFVYGILVNRYESQPAILHGYTKIIRGFASIVKTNNIDDFVGGELIEVDDLEFKRIDEIESFPTYYTRFKVNVEVGDGLERCWVYQQLEDYKKNEIY
jgi:gamma-glutamylcyclotransferase (GGCT)/AIG2-like uncharacterized protein YtfP